MTDTDIVADVLARLGEMKARDAARTQGRFVLGQGFHGHIVFRAAPHVILGRFCGGRAWRNAEFFSHASTDVPDLIACVEAQAAIIAEQAADIKLGDQARNLQAARIEALEAQRDERISDDHERSFRDMGPSRSHGLSVAQSDIIGDVIRIADGWCQYARNTLKPNSEDYREAHLDKSRIEEAGKLWNERKTP